MLDFTRIGMYTTLNNIGNALGVLRREGKYVNACDDLLGIRQMVKKDLDNKKGNVLAVIILEVLAVRDNLYTPFHIQDKTDLLQVYC